MHAEPNRHDVGPPGAVRRVWLSTRIVTAAGIEPDNVPARRRYAAAGGVEEPMVYVTFKL